VYTVARTRAARSRSCAASVALRRRGQATATPEGKRVLASLEMPPAAVVEEIFADGLHRDPEQAKTWVAVVDGNKQQLALLEQQALRHELDLTVVVDVITSSSTCGRPAPS